MNLETRETVTYQDDRVVVTNTRVVIDSKTFAMANVTSVEATTVPPNTSLSCFVVFVGILMALGGTLPGLFLWQESSRLAIAILVIGLLAGGGVFLGGVYMAFKAKPSYAISMVTAAGEIKALVSKDKAHIEAIVRAINEAIIRRG